jgi:Metallopeptidase toxin 3
MAWLGKEDREKYPDLYYWLTHELPQLPDKKPKVWSAFYRHAAGNLFEGMFARNSIVWAFPPLIRVESYQMMQCEDDGDPIPQKDGSFVQKRKRGWYGYTVPTLGKQEIYVASDLAQGARAAEVGPILEATVLHELVHWCRKVSGKDVNDEGPPYDFEKEAYGKVMFRTWQSCMSIQYFETK